MTQQEPTISGFRPEGGPEITTQNPWFIAYRQPMSFIDRNSGLVKKSAADGGQMNYVDMKPGALIVVDFAGVSTVLVPQERYTTNLIENTPVMHYELPGGGNDGSGIEANILAAAEIELAEEVGMAADELIILGNTRRGLLPHPTLLDQNLTILARGARYLHSGPSHESNEILGAPETFTWRETEDMYVLPNGIVSSEGNKIISSAPTVASLALAQVWLLRHEELGPKTII